MVYTIRYKQILLVNNMRIKWRNIFSLILTGIVSVPVFADLPVEPLGKINTLKTPYPKHWVFAHDATFFHMNDGRYVLLDPLENIAASQFKGMIDGAFISAFTQAPSREEAYVIETFYSRGTRGERTDVVTFYDLKNLAPVGEVIMPPGRRLNSMPERYAAQTILDENLLLVTNMNPGTSVSVIDLEQRTFLGDIPVPGCILTYPTGKNGFSSLCADGAMLTTVINKKGEVVKTHRSKSFFNSDDDPIFEKPAIIDGIAYFPSFHGNVYPVNLRGEKARPGTPWSLLSKRDKMQGWRPGGWQLNAEDELGHFYILMHPKGRNGSHKDGGDEIWVYDAKQKKRIKRISLKTRGISVSATRGDNPLLVVTNAAMQIDVYEAKSGNYLRTMSFGQETPFLVHPVM